MNLPIANRTLSRRQLLSRCGYGVGAMALADLMAPEASQGATPPLASSSTRPSHYRPQANSVIFIFMSGGPSQVDLFDPKPELTRLDGHPIPTSLTENLADPIIRTSARVMASPRTFHSFGQCGMQFSDYVPYMGSIADELCMIRSMRSEQSNHDPAQLLLSCGTPLFGNPSIGSWITYGLGSESQEMPGYVVLLSNSGKGVDAGSALWGSGFMPSNYRGVTFRNSGEPVLHLATPPGISRSAQRARLDAIQDLNRMHRQSTGDAEIDSRIAAY